MPFASVYFAFCYQRPLMMNGFVSVEMDPPPQHGDYTTKINVHDCRHAMIESCRRLKRVITTTSTKLTRIYGGPGLFRGDATLCVCPIAMDVTAAASAVTKSSSHVDAVPSDTIAC
jgi:hypothetical protein